MPGMCNHDQGHPFITGLAYSRSYLSLRACVHVCMCEYQGVYACMCVCVYVFLHACMAQNPSKQYII